MREYFSSLLQAICWFCCCSWGNFM